MPPVALEPELGTSTVGVAPDGAVAPPSAAVSCIVLAVGIGIFGSLVLTPGAPRLETLIQSEPVCGAVLEEPFLSQTRDEPDAVKVSLKICLVPAASRQRMLLRTPSELLVCAGPSK